MIKSFNNRVILRCYIKGSRASYNTKTGPSADVFYQWLGEKYQSHAKLSLWRPNPGFFQFTVISQLQGEKIVKALSELQITLLTCELYPQAIINQVFYFSRRNIFKLLIISNLGRIGYRGCFCRY